MSMSAATPVCAARIQAADVLEYVTRSLRERWGHQLPGPDPQETVRGFCERFGADKAMIVARAVFEDHRGLWQGAPVTIRRFTAAHDEFFAIPLLSGAHA